MAAVIHYRMEFGKNNVFMIQAGNNTNTPERGELPAKRRGQTLFGKKITHEVLSKALAAGGEIRVTKLTDNYSFKDLLKKEDETVIPLFGEDTKGRIHVFSEESRVTPQPGWSVINITSPGRDKHHGDSQSPAQ
jgi:hypothetical protein